MDSTTNPVWYAVGPAAVLFVFGLACGGGGATFGENSPGNAGYGGGTYLDDAVVRSDTPEGVGENGSLAVDPDTETTYTLQKRRIGEVEQKRVVAVTVHGEALELMDATDYVDVRILFPARSVLVMAEPLYSEEAVADGRCRQPSAIERDARRCGDELIWFDKVTHARIDQRATASRYHGTRLSSKRNYLVVADNFYERAPVHLLDVHTGKTNVVPQEGDWFEGMWLHGEDALITAHFSRISPAEDAESFLQIREWFPQPGQSLAAQGQTLCFHSTDTPLPEGCESYMIPGIDPMFFTGFSWIGVSPDDRWVAVPAQRRDGRAVVVVVDRQTRTLEFVEDAYGPVGFTPDSSRMVAFGWDHPNTEVDPLFNIPRGGGEGPHLVLVDLETMEVALQPTPTMETPTYFVSRDSNDVVIVNAYGSEGMLILDLDAHTSTRMASPAVAEAGRALYGATALAQLDPTRPQASAEGAQVRRASDVVAREDIRASGCGEAMCYAGEGSIVTLGEFVSRTGHRELWLVESGKLLRVGLDLAEVREVTLDGVPAHINILPRHDRLVIDAVGEQRLRFFDPSRREVDMETSIELGWTAR